MMTVLQPELSQMGYSLPLPCVAVWEGAAGGTDAVPVPHRRDEQEEQQERFTTRLCEQHKRNLWSVLCPQPQG